MKTSKLRCIIDSMKLTIIPLKEDIITVMEVIKEIHKSGDYTKSDKMRNLTDSAAMLLRYLIDNCYTSKYFDYTFIMESKDILNDCFDNTHIDAFNKYKDALHEYLFDEKYNNTYFLCNEYHIQPHKQLLPYHYNDTLLILAMSDLIRIFYDYIFILNRTIKSKSQKYNYQRGNKFILEKFFTETYSENKVQDHYLFRLEKNGIISKYVTYENISKYIESSEVNTIISDIEENSMMLRNTNDYGVNFKQMMLKLNIQEDICESDWSFYESILLCKSIKYYYA